MPDPPPARPPPDVRVDPLDGVVGAAEVGVPAAAFLAAAAFPGAAALTAFPTAACALSADSPLPALRFVGAGLATCAGLRGTVVRTTEEVGVPPVAGRMIRGDVRACETATRRAAVSAPASDVVTPATTNNATPVPIALMQAR